MPKYELTRITYPTKIIAYDNYTLHSLSYEVNILTFELKFWRNAVEATINPCNTKWKSLTATVATALTAVVVFVRWRSSDEIFAWIVGPTLLLRQLIGLQQD